MRVSRGSLLLLVLAGAAGAQEDTAASAAGLRRSAQTVLERAGCQTELPEGRRPGSGNGGRSPDRGGEHRLPSDSRPRNASGLELDFGGGSGLAQFLLIAVLVAALAVAITAIVRRRGDDRLPPPRARQRHAVAGEVLPPPAAGADLPDHALLARQGRFAEAVHALLLAALQLLGQRLGRGLPRDATGRDALRLSAALPATGTLGGLVRAVERSHFGGQRADAGDYAAALQQYEQWSEACSRSA